MKVLTGMQMADVDRRAINESNIDGLILMENAGIKVYQKIKRLIEGWNDTQDTLFKGVLVISGKGNNGGDGFVIARQLIQDNIPVNIFATAELSEYSGDALKVAKALENFGDINIITEDTIEDLRDSVLEASIVVDALLGTGIKGAAEGLYSEVIDIINESDGIIVSVDVPSGVIADTGDVYANAVEADYTVTFAAPKMGLLLYPGADYVGDLTVVDIGIPDFLLETTESNVFLTTEEHVFELLPWRPENSNKGTFGKVLTIAGSGNMTGAGLLSAYSTLKVGAGLSTLAAPESLLPYYTGVYPEITFMSLKETASKAISEQAAKAVIDKLEDYSVVVIGPGIGTDPETARFTSIVLESVMEKNLPIVVDADALNCLATSHTTLKLYNKAVITPHPRELSRLLSVGIEDILKDKIGVIKKAQQKYNCNVVLKGAKTLTASDSTIYINPAASSALATAGSGDVLCGLIAGLASQGLDIYDASVCGVYIHGQAGLLASEQNTEYSVVATDIMNYVSKALYQLSVL